MERRNLQFSTYDELVAEIEQLHRSGYKQLGNWNLGQICDHLAYYLRGSLEGFPFRLPWIVRRLIGRRILRRILRGERRPAGGRTIPASVPPGRVDELTAVAATCALVRRLSDPAVPLHPSPLFDRLTPDEWRILHLSHAAHHLGFLIPKES